MEREYFVPKSPPTKPWYARQCMRISQYDWFVIGRCPLSVDERCGTPNYICSPQCGHRCSVCVGRGEHVLAFGLKRNEAQRIVKMDSIEEMHDYLLSLKGRFVLFPSLKESWRTGVPQRIYPLAHVSMEKREHI